LQAFADLANFLSHVVTLYNDKCEEFVNLLHDFVEKHHVAMDRTVRASLMSCLILLRNKQAIPAVKLLKLCFLLFRCADKALRQHMHKHIVSDVRNINRQTNNQQLNKTLQNFMFTMISDPNPIAAKKSLDVMIELYRRKVWTDAKTANVMAEACLSPHAKVCLEKMIIITIMIFVSFRCL
jgi:protein SDA1